MPATNGSEYRSPARRSFLARVFLWITIGLEVVTLGAAIHLSSLLAAIKGGWEVSETALAANDGIYTAIGWAQLAVFIPTVVLFCMWMFRSYRNLRPLGVPKTRFSAAWAVGWFFVPIMQLFRPVQVMGEIWRGSAGEGRPGIPSIVSAWWISYMIANLVGNRVLALSNAQTVDQFVQKAAFDIVTSVATIAAGVLAILIIARISEMQERKWKTRGVLDDIA